MLKKSLLIPTFFIAAISIAVWLFSTQPVAQDQAVRHITQQQMVDKLKQGNAVLIDIRTPQEFQSGSIPGSVHLPIKSITEDISLLDQFQEKELIFYCHSGGRVKKLTDFVQSTDHSAADRLFHLLGDFSGWQESGREIK